MFRRRKNIETNLDKKTNIQDKKEYDSQSIPSSISKCQETLKSIFSNSTDVVIEPFDTYKEKAMVVYIDGLVNKDLMDRDILSLLKSKDFNGNIPLTIHAHCKEKERLNEVVDDIVEANIVLFYENLKKAIIINFKTWDKRSIEAPDAESVTRGPREGFIESIRTNTSLLRRKIKNPNLVIESLTLGRQSNTTIELAYIKGIVNQNVLKILEDRLSQIDTDIILETSHIEQYIEDSPFSPVSGIGLTQKPDIVATRILEGRVAIFVDGTPHVITVPELFIENLQSKSDDYSRVLYSTLIRLFRIIGLFLSVILPGLGVAIITYNQEMMPSIFLANLISSTQKTPLPSAAEAFVLLIMFGLVRESGARLPKNFGSAVSIVGSLIIGDAAISAGLVSAPMVIIIALTAICSFIVPNLEEFVMVNQVFFLFLGSTMGLIGIGSGIVLMLTSLASTESFGVPILSSTSKEELKDSLIKVPFYLQKFRPQSIAKNNVKRR